MELVGIVIFTVIFIGAPIYYTIDHIKNPTFVEVPQFENERDKCESPIELRLFDALTFNGYDLKTQVKCGRYRIDIAIPRYNLAIECDGKKYHSTPKQRAHDRKKNAHLRKEGWKVLRFSGSQIHRNLPSVLRKIQDSI